MVGWRRGLFFSLSILFCAFLKHWGLHSSQERALVQHLILEISKCIYIACRLYFGYVLECDPQNSLGNLSRIALLLQIRKLIQVGFHLIQPQESANKCVLWSPPGEGVRIDVWKRDVLFWGPRGSLLSFCLCGEEGDACLFWGVLRTPRILPLFSGPSWDLNTICVSHLYACTQHLLFWFLGSYFLYLACA